MWQAAPLMIPELATYSPSSGRTRESAIGVMKVETERLTDKHGPYIDKDEQRNIGKFLQRKDKRKHMVRHTLSEPVQRMESMARIRCRHNPLVVRLMQNLVHPRMVQTSVDPIYEEVGKGDKERDLYVIVQRKGGV